MAVLSPELSSLVLGSLDPTVLETQNQTASVMYGWLFLCGLSGSIFINIFMGGFREVFKWVLGVKEALTS